MKKKLLWFLAIVAIGFGVYKFFFAEKREINVLVFSKTESFRHQSIGIGKKAIIELGQQKGFSVDTTEDSNIFKEKNLQNYNVVIFLHTTGNILNDAQQLEFNRFIQAGGGFVGIHAAADTEYEWPWYGQLVGAYFNGHPNEPNVREAEIAVLNKEHPATAHLPDRWKRSDEWYNYKSINPAIQVLMNLDESTYEGGTNGEKHPIAWHHEFDGGRSFYTGLGHTDESFEDPLFIEHLWGGIDYAAGPGKPVDYNQSTVAPEENRFQKVVLESGLSEPMELEILPDNRLLYIQRSGEVRLHDPATAETKTITNINVHKEHEDGLLGMALDPVVIFKIRIERH
ncbi:MAG: ThuA domain-containing protein, partial [Bacteroidota bacterium]